MIGSRYIARRLEKQIVDSLQHAPAVSITGARQIGKTTLADRIAQRFDAARFDLAGYAHRELMKNPMEALQAYHGRLVVIDEVQHVPTLFLELLPVIDRRIEMGHRTCQFLFLGSSGGESLGQLHETLSSRRRHIPMTGIDALEVEDREMHTLWDRGSYPKSFLAESLDESKKWRTSHFDSLFLGQPVDLQNRLSKLLAAIIESQGNTASKHKWCTVLETNTKTLENDLSRLDQIFLIRRLLPYSGKLIKKLVKASKYYMRDSGLVHWLWDISIQEQLKIHETSRPSLANPSGRLIGKSWEGFVIENLHSLLRTGARPYFYRSYEGNELDLVIQFRGDEIWAIETKYSSNGALTKGNVQALTELKPTKTFVVHGGDKEVQLPHGVWSIPLRTMMLKLQVRLDA